ncbi:MAG: hypothetical protein ABGY09_00665 [Euryarchaeota archaeon]
MVDDQVVELTLRPGVEVGRVQPVQSSSSSLREGWEQWVVDSILWVDGSVVIHDKRGDHRVDFSAHVEVKFRDPVAPIARLSMGLLRSLGGSLTLRVPLDHIDVFATLGASEWWRAKERVRVVFETPEGTFELEPPNTLELSLSPEPFRVRVEVYEDGRLKACSEYEIQPGPAIIHLFGLRYIQAQLTSKILKQAPSVKFLQPEVLRTSKTEPSTEVIIPFILETPTDTIPYTLHIQLPGPYPLPDGGTILKALLTFSTLNLVRVLNHLLNVPDEVLNRPFTVPRPSSSNRSPNRSPWGSRTPSFYSYPP